MLVQSDVMPPMLLDRERALHSVDGLLEASLRSRRDVGRAWGTTRGQADGLVCVACATHMRPSHAQWSAGWVDWRERLAA
jgi:hypothetical protein